MRTNEFYEYRNVYILSFFPITFKFFRYAFEDFWETGIFYPPKYHLNNCFIKK